MARIQFRSYGFVGKVAPVIDLQHKLVRLSIIDQDDKAVGYVEYSFEEMPLANPNVDLTKGDDQ